MKVLIDQTKCIAAGQCVLAATEVFDQRESDGIVTLLQVRPAPELYASVREAVNLCPAQAITLEESN